MGDDHEVNCSGEHCADHWKIEERRQDDRTRREVEANLINHIPRLLTLLNRLIGTAVLIGVMLSGSYVYTTIVDSKSTVSDRDIRIDLKDMSTYLNKLAVIVGKNESKHASVLYQMRKLNSNLKNLFDGGKYWVEDSPINRYHGAYNGKVKK